MGFFSKHKKIVGAVLLVVILAGVITPTRTASAAWWGWLLGAGVTTVAGLTAPFWGLPAAGVAGVVAVSAAATSVLTVISGYQGVQAVKEAVAGSPDWVTQKVIDLLGYLIKNTLSALVTISAQIFDWSIKMNIDSRMYSSLTALTIGWKLVRDISNMFSIFFLLYIAIATMLQVSGVDAKRAVTNVIAGALLVNFSMFMAGLMIDGSNILTKEFYNAITKQQTIPLPNVVLQTSGIASFINPDASKHPSPNPLENSNVHTVVTIMLLLVIARFFFTSIFLFIGRLVALYFLMLLSPFAVIGISIPFFKQYQNQWWTMMGNQLLLGPFVMFVLWFALMVGSSSIAMPGATPAKVVMAEPANQSSMYLAQAGGAGTPPDPTAGRAGAAGAAAVDTADAVTEQLLGYMQFLLVLGLLTFGVSEAQKLSGQAGAGLLELGKMAAGATGAAFLGGAVTVASGVVGNAGKVVAQSDWANKLKTSDKTGFGGMMTRAAGRSTVWAGEQAAKRSFDPRAIPGVGQYINQGFGYATAGASLGGPINAGGVMAGSDEAKDKAAFLAELAAIKKNNAGPDKKPERDRLTSALMNRQPASRHQLLFEAAGADNQAMNEHLSEKDLLVQLGGKVKDAAGNPLDNDKLKELRDEFIDSDNLNESHKGFKDDATITRLATKHKISEDAVKDGFATYKSSNSAKIDNALSKMDSSDVKRKKEARRGIQDKEKAADSKNLIKEKLEEIERTADPTARRILENRARLAIMPTLDLTDSATLELGKKYLTSKPVYLGLGSSQLRKMAQDDPLGITKSVRTQMRIDILANGTASGKKFMLSDKGRELYPLP